MLLYPEHLSAAGKRLQEPGALLLMLLASSPSVQFMHCWTAGFLLRIKSQLLRASCLRASDFNSTQCLEFVNLIQFCTCPTQHHCNSGKYLNTHLRKAHGNGGNIAEWKLTLLPATQGWNPLISIGKIDSWIQKYFAEFYTSVSALTTPATKLVQGTCWGLYNFNLLSRSYLIFDDVSPK